MNKEELRARYRTLRRAIPEDRRKEAAQQLFKAIQALSFDRIASFCSMPDEIDTRPLNAFFASQGRLLLPKVSHTLEYHLVTDLSSLRPASYSLLEPDFPAPMVLNVQDLLLVPGLAFDSTHFRLGFGKGHFDRLLAANPNVSTIGVGFREQLSSEPLPRDPWDLPVQKLLLF